MDQLQAYLQTNLPPSVLSHLTTHSATYFKAYQTISSLQKTVTVNVISPLLSITTTNPDITSLILLLAILFLSLAFLRMLYRAIMWWIRMAFRVAFWGIMLLIGVWVYNRGVEGAWVDLQDVGEFWKKEYERYDNAGRIRGAYGAGGYDNKYNRGWR